MKDLNAKIKQLEEHQRSGLDDEILNSPKNENQKSEHAGGTGSSGQSDNAKGGSPIMKMVEISNVQIDELKEQIEKLNSKITNLETEKSKVLSEKQTIESEKEALKIQIVEKEMNKFPQ